MIYLCHSIQGAQIDVPSERNLKVTYNQETGEPMYLHLYSDPELVTLIAKYFWHPGNYTVSQKKFPTLRDVCVELGDEGNGCQDTPLSLSILMKILRPRPKS